MDSDAYNRGIYEGLMEEDFFYVAGRLGATLPGGYNFIIF